MDYLKRVLIAIDQLFAVMFFAAEPDETISAMAHRLKWTRLEAFINWLFRDPNHCREAYEAERDGDQLPEEYRQ